MDLIDELHVVDRSVGLGVLPAGPARVITLSRLYTAPLADVWRAVTDIDELCEWFLPTTGHLRVGGSYAVEGNAFGQVRACDAPHRLQVTWNFPAATCAEDSSFVEICLAPMGEYTRFRLEHIVVVPGEAWTRFGPGAVGVGWDLTVLGLSGHLAGVPIGDVADLSLDPGMRDVMAASSEAWGEAHEAAGTPTAVAVSAVAATTAFYVPPQEA